MDPARDRVFALNPDPEYRRLRAARVALLGFTVILVFGIATLAIKASENTLAGGSAALVLGGSILSIGVGAGIWGIIGLGRGADNCRMNQEGFTLVYRSDRATRFLWGDPALRIKMYELLSKGRSTYSIATRRPSLNPIPQELYQTILSEARSRALGVTEHTDTLSSGHQTTTVIRAANNPPQA
jgi:hypothetical protein